MVYESRCYGQTDYKSRKRAFQLYDLLLMINLVSNSRSTERPALPQSDQMRSSEIDAFERSYPQLREAMNVTNTELRMRSRQKGTGGHPRADGEGHTHSEDDPKLGDAHEEVARWDPGGGAEPDERDHRTDRSLTDRERSQEELAERRERYPPEIDEKTNSQSVPKGRWSRRREVPRCIKLSGTIVPYARHLAEG
jgi:hypothetical protein